MIVRRFITIRTLYLVLGSLIGLSGLNSRATLIRQQRTKNQVPSTKYQEQNTKGEERRSRDPDSGIQPTVNHVRQRIRKDVGDADDEHTALDDAVVAFCYPIFH